MTTAQIFEHEKISPYPTTDFRLPYSAAGEEQLQGKLFSRSHLRLKVIVGFEGISVGDWLGYDNSPATTDYFGNLYALA